MTRPRKDPVTAYAKAVVTGRTVASRLVRLAGERHLADLKAGAKRGLRWNLEAATDAIEFFPAVLRLAEGPHAGRPFELQPWQQFIVGSLFGWQAADGMRRFRTAYIETGKGNGKTPLAAGIGLLGLVADHEAGAQVYAAAVTREQSGILFADAERMVAASPELAERIAVNVGNLAHAASGSYFRPVSSEARSLDGKRVHMALIDELHEHPSADVVDKMRAGTKGRRQALIFEITNAGYDRHSVCWQHHVFSQQVLEGVKANDSWFAYVCGLDAGDDWRDARVWAKANPNLGVSVTVQYLREQVEEAEAMPAKQSLVRRLNFCEWTETAGAWIAPAVWDRGAGTVPDAALAGRPCFLGLDLSSTTDLTALALVFPLDDGRVVVRCRFWMPEANVAKRISTDHVPFDVWIRDGCVATTPGNVVDYEAVLAAVLEEASRYAVRELAYDRWAATWIISQLQQRWPEGGGGPQVVPFGQGFASMSAPTKEFEKLVLAGRLLHGGNPVLRWMLGNVALEADAAGNLKVHKGRSSDRIDGIVAALMALGRAMLRPSEDGSGWEFVTWPLPQIGDRPGEGGFMPAPGL
jgi:phage terminase large subunit-like protein